VPAAPTAGRAGSRDSVDLAGLVERVHLERCLAERVVPDTEVHHDPDVTWVVQPLGSAWRNAGIGARFAAAEAADRLDTLVARYATNARGMGLWVSPLSTPDDLPALLRARRLGCRHYFPAMVRHRSARVARHVAPKDLEVGRLRDLSAFATVPHPAIGPPTTVMRRFAQTRLRALLGAPAAPTQAFVAWLGDVPAGAVELFLGSDAAGLHDLVVDERHRGHGIGSALIERVCAEAWRAGRDRVALLASTDGAPVYARRGFAEVARFGYYYRSFQARAAGTANLQHPTPRKPW
jgi:ribosomal protein S18 acetylase RimI-like enzyme